MRRLRTIVFRGTALLLVMASVAGWVRSLWASDRIGYHGGTWLVAIETERGGGVQVRWMAARPEAPPGWNRSSY